MNIFLLFSALQILQSDNGSEFTAAMINELKVMWTIPIIVHVECAAPSFTVPVSNTSPGSVDESSSKDVSILTVEGTDTDGDTLMFSLVTQNPTSPPFSLDSITGVLKTPTGLDAEFSLTYNFTFGVSDGTTTLNSVVYTLNINNINDVTPVFQGTPYNTSLLKSVSNGHQVIDVNATDGDAIPSTITYSLISGNSPVTFALDPNTGKINVSDSTQLDPESTPTYSLIIQASDGTYAETVIVSITVIALGKDETTTDNDKDDTGLIVGLVIGGLFVVCVLCGVLAVKYGSKIKEENPENNKIADCSLPRIMQPHRMAETRPPTDTRKTKTKGNNKVGPDDTAGQDRQMTPLPSIFITKSYN